jgi:hypothetical protein
MEENSISFQLNYRGKRVERHQWNYEFSTEIQVDLRASGPCVPVYEVAAYLIENGIETYCCYAIFKAFVLLFDENTPYSNTEWLIYNQDKYLGLYFKEHQRQFELCYKNSYWWDQPYSLRCQEGRIRALRKFANLCYKTGGCDSTNYNSVV